MASLKFIKNIQSPNGTVLQLLSSYIFGDNDIQPYNPLNVYSRGSMILVFNTITNRFEILQCNDDNVTGPFNPSKWVRNTVNEYIGGSKVNDKLIILSVEQPTDPANLVWYQIKNTREDDGIDPDKIGNVERILILSGNEFIGQDDPPDNHNIKLWMDYEP